MQIKLNKWEFDHCSNEQAKSWVELSEIENELDGDYELSLFVDKARVMRVSIYRDQWGTYITFQIDDKSFTIAQEDGTKSFMDAFISGLIGLKPITDIDTKPPSKIN